MRRRLLLHGADVFDGASEPARADVVVQDGLIADVGHGLDGDDAVDLSGCTLLPGFVDAHVHVNYDTVDSFEILKRPFTWEFFASVVNLQRTLSAGVTLVRDAGGADSGVRQAVAQGLIPGPDLQISITMLSQTGGHGDAWAPCGMALAGFGAAHPGRPSGITDGPEALRRRVREIVRAGGDVIKIATSGGVLSPGTDPQRSEYSQDEVDAVVQEARAAGKYVMAHAQAADGVKRAVRAGAASIEHGVYLDDEAIDLMLRAGTYLVPTLSAVRSLLERVETGESRLPETVIRKVHEVADVHASSVLRAASAGVPIAMGTDAPVTPHGRNLDELKHLVDHAKLSPLEALRAGTSHGARLLGKQDTHGRLRPGAVANMVAVQGSVQDVHSLPERVASVWKAGSAVRAGSSAETAP